MRETVLLLVAIPLLIPALAAGPAAGPGEQARPSPRRPVHTYSIVARDARTGQLGVAVQSHWFQVGTIVPWAEAGVGAVATQSFVDPSYGPRGLQLMRGGVPAPEALRRLVEADDGRDVRQVAMVDADGRVAAWTGARCIAAAGHVEGDGFSVQANLMANERVWPAMAKAFVASEGQPLAERLLAALEAAEAEGGDVRGRQSAALVVVRAQTTGEPWKDRLVDLRVDDSPRPLEELRRLLRLHRAYESMNAGDEALAAGDAARALELYGAAADLAPEIVEIPFWQAVTLADTGRLAEALPIFRRVFAAEDRWRGILGRLPASGLLAQEKVDAILEATQ
ncbi:MAG: DUF1028 domain-containing protein [Acidobacteria bacterium]|nr:MAG: DUF1028 domain-containing protein [Acidobacteriota bacterium]